jgi:hypothetical protein
MAKWDTVIVGGGIAGLSVGALLTNNGKRALILEKDSHIGGRAFSVNYQGHIVDNGYHGIAQTGCLHEIFSRVGKSFPDIVFYDRAEILHEGKWRNISELFPHKEFRRILNEDIVARSREELESYDGISIKEWLSQRTDDKGLHLYFWYSCWGLLGGHRYEDFAASVPLLLFKEQIEKVGSLRHFLGNPRYGCSSLAEPLAEVIRDKGSEIRTNAKVASIVIEDGKARGVRLETGDRVFASQLVDTELVEAPIVISTLPVWDLFSIVSEDQFPRWYVDWVEGIKQRTAPIFTLVCGMDATLWDDQGTSRWVDRLPRTEKGALFLQLPYGDAVGQPQFGCMLQSHWDEVPSLFEANRAKNRLGLQKIWDLFEEDIKELFPDFERHCLWKIRHTAPWALAFAPGVVGRFRPSIKPPEVENLYLVSDTVREAKTLGVESVGCAALHCVDHILALK